MVSAYREETHWWNKLASKNKHIDHVEPDSLTHYSTHGNFCAVKSHFIWANAAPLPSLIYKAQQRLLIQDLRGSSECLQDLNEWGGDFSMLYFPSLKNFGIKDLNLKWKADYLSQFINSSGIETNDPSPENSWCACLRCSHSPLPHTCAHKNSPLRIQEMCSKDKTAVLSSLCSLFSFIIEHCCNPGKAP